MCCLFGVNYFFKLGSKIEATKTPIFDLKVDSVIEMIFLYNARYSIVLLRPKNSVKLLAQSVENRFVWGNEFEFLAILFLKEEKAPDNWTFFS